MDMAGTTLIHAKVNSFTTTVFVPSGKVVNNILVPFLISRTPKGSQEHWEIQWTVI